MHKVRFISFIFLILISGYLIAQNQYSKDIKIAENYIQRAMELKDINLDSSIENLNQAEKIALEQNNADILSEVYFSKAKVLDTYQMYDSSKVFYELAAPYFLEIDDTLSAAKCYNNVGVTDYYYGRFEQALLVYDKALDLLKYSDEPILKSKIANNLGLINKALGNYTEAISQFQEVISLNEKVGNNDGIASGYWNIGNIYWEYKSSEKALENYNKALEYFAKTGDTEFVASVYNNIGLVYHEQGKDEDAISNYDKAINISKKNNDDISLATGIMNKAVIIDETGDYNSSEELFTEALQIFEKNSYGLGVFVCKLNLSGIYAVRDQHELAIKTVLDALNIEGIEQPIKYLSEGYLILAQNYSEIGSFKDANTYYQKYFDIQDTIFGTEIKKQVAELQAKYESDKDKAQLELYEQQMKIQNLELEHKEKQFHLTALILILSLIFISFLVILYSQKQKSYLALVKQNVDIAKKDIEKEIILDEAAKNDLSKQNNPLLCDENKSEFQKKLDNLMLKEKVFIRKQITINDLAKLLETNRNYLSEFINEHFNTNFNNFINEYRVKEARKLLLINEYRNYTIEGIADTVGFHTKATFNSAFKKITGVTPSFFRNNSHKIYKLMLIEHESKVLKKRQI